MEEQKREDQEQMEAAASENRKNIKPDMPRRTLMLWVLAGMYLLYTGYKLCSNVIKGVDGGGIGFLFAGIGFLAIGGALFFFGAKGMFKEDKLRKEQEAAAAAAAEEPSEGVEEVMEELPSEEPKKKLTIAERASLAKRLEEEEAAESEE